MKGAVAMIMSLAGAMDFSSCKNYEYTNTDNPHATRSKWRGWDPDYDTKRHRAKKKRRAKNKAATAARRRNRK